VGVRYMLCLISFIAVIIFLFGFISVNWLFFIKRGAAGRPAIKVK
jgi:hypothetical protein